MAPYWSGAKRQSATLPSHDRPVTPRAGRLTVCPWRAWGPRSMTAVPSMTAEKSQAPSRRSSGVAAEGRSAIARSRSGRGAEPTSTGPSTLPLKWAPLIHRPQEGQARCAPSRIGVPAGGARQAAPSSDADDSLRLRAWRSSAVQPTRTRSGLPVEARGHEVPAPLAERSRALRVEHPPAHAEAKAERTLLLDLEREPRLVHLRPPPEHRLAPPDGRGRPDERRDRDAPARPAARRSRRPGTYDPASMGWKRPQCSPSAGLGDGTRSRPGPRGSGSPHTIRTKSRR